ncbi:MAG: hypothetical protein CMD30_01730, partial [Flavobacteriales bacterium]|nr:hypothetical protein [Flavobacteriales bacterium]
MNLRKFFIVLCLSFAFNVKADFEFKLTCEFGASIFYIYLVPPKEKKSWYMRVDGLSEYDFDSKMYKSYIRDRKYGQKVRIPRLGYKVNPSAFNFNFSTGSLSINRLNMKAYHSSRIPG